MFFGVNRFCFHTHLVPPHFTSHNLATSFQRQLFLFSHLLGPSVFHFSHWQHVFNVNRFYFHTRLVPPHFTYQHLTYFQRKSFMFSHLLGPARIAHSWEIRIGCTAFPQFSHPQTTYPEISHPLAFRVCLSLRCKTAQCIALSEPEWIVHFPLYASFGVARATFN